ncbi:serine acetyltransferase [Aliikangiella marina]|uniref:Serine acetyltransferase n=1 Tax=Aliikangiella marina TaxID=1712262 RepID=A0A545TBM2_9GAMM|nr:serine acetyltransferase [Aliikangiella marina]TQV74609.1 serine acetyltransferase [Aliikangiella marina]
MHKDIKIKWKDDLSRYPKKPWLREPSIWAVYWHRKGESIDLMKDGFFKKIAMSFYWIIFHFVTLATGISIAKSIKIGGGLRIYHFGNVFIHQNTVIGANCTLRQGVTLGNRYNDEFAPTLGDNVELGAYAQVLGDVTVGNNAKIGALSVVLENVPENHTAVGIPAKVKSNTKSQSIDA